MEAEITISFTGIRLKCREQNVAVKMSRTKCRGQKYRLTIISSEKCRAHNVAVA